MTEVVRVPSILLMRWGLQAEGGLGTSWGDGGTAPGVEEAETEPRRPPSWAPGSASWEELGSPHLVQLRAAGAGAHNTQGVLARTGHAGCAVRHLVTCFHLRSPQGSLEVMERLCNGNQDGGQPRPHPPVFWMDA